MYSEIKFQTFSSKPIKNHQQHHKVQNFLPTNTLYIQLLHKIRKDSNFKDEPKTQENKTNLGKHTMQAWMGNFKNNPSQESSNQY